MLIIKKPFSSLKSNKESVKITKGLNHTENAENDNENKNDENIPLTQTNTEVKAENGNHLSNCVKAVNMEGPNSMVIMKFAPL